MTVIAWDGETLAADSQLNYGTNRLTCEKLFRLSDGGMVGMAGTAAKCIRLLRYIRGEGPAPKRLMSTEAIRVHPDGTVDLYPSTAVPERITSKLVVIGCGGNIALGAMAAGKTAAEAVAIAIEHDSNCGGPVVTMRTESGLT